MKKLAATVIFILFGCAVCGQTFDTEYYPQGEWREAVSFETDDHIFFSPAWHTADPFRELSRYRFGAVRYRERGLDGRHRTVRLGSIDLSDNISARPDYSLISLLSKSGLAKTYNPPLVAGDTPAGIGYSDNYSMKSAAARQLFLSVRASDRHSRATADIRHDHLHGNGWSHSLSLSAQYGPDGHIRGIRSDGVGGVLSVTRERNDRSRLTFFAAGSFSERGLRTAATREAFSLTGDNLYNPAWGWLNGEVRNSRERRVRQGLAAVEFERRLTANRTLSVTAAFGRSRNGQTRLAWYDTHSPMPDYYRRMPSYFPDWSAADIIADAWRSGDPTVTQLDWTELYYANTLSADGAATYIVEEQVELSSNLHFNLRIDREIAKAFTVSYGLLLRLDRSRYFKEAADMLGGSYVMNVDQYVTDDEGDYYTGPLNENDLRNPGRRIGKGDRFGYDYDVSRRKPSVYGIVRRDGARWGTAASASLTYTGLRHNGYYEKELFPGDASYGRSGTAAFTTFSLGASAYWNASVRHRFSLSALASTEAPFADNIWISPKQNNYMIDSRVPMGIHGTELSWSFAGKTLDLRVTGFLHSARKETEIRQYYDDLSSTFSNMVIRGMDKLYYGIEAGADIRIVRWLSLALGGSVGEYRYNSEPTATVFADADNSVVSENITCYLSGLKTGSPQRVAAAALTYSDRRRWRVSISGEYMGDRYVDINPLYHSSRIVGINSAPEIMNLFTSQERLSDAFTLGLSVSKGFVLGKGYLRLAGSVRNLLSSQIIYSGYEQMRIMRSGSGINRTLVPFPSKYLYSYPLTWNITVSYRL